EAKLIDGDDDAGPLADAIRALKAKRDGWAAELAAAEHEAATPLADAWEDAQTLAEALDKAPNKEEARTRLRGALRGVVEGIWCVLVAGGSVRWAAVQLRFVGDAHRDYLIVHTPAKGNASAKRKAKTEAVSFHEAGPSPLDFRKAKDVAKLLRELEQ